MTTIKTAEQVATDAEVIAGLNAWQGRERLGTTLGAWGSVKITKMRAALEAAAVVRDAGLLAEAGDDFPTLGNHREPSESQVEAGARIIHGNYRDESWGDYGDKVWAMGTFRAALAAAHLTAPAAPKAAPVDEGKIADVLARHWAYLMGSSVIACRCGKTWSVWSEHAKHQAEVMVEALGGKQ